MSEPTPEQQQYQVIWDELDAAEHENEHLKNQLAHVKAMLDAASGRARAVRHRAIGILKTVPHPDAGVRRAIDVLEKPDQ